MPIKKSAIRALRQIKKRTEHNKIIKRNLAYLERQFTKCIRDNLKEKATEYYRKLQKALDKAAKSGVIKKNKSSRKKSRLSKALNKLSKRKV